MRCTRLRIDKSRKFTESTQHGTLFKCSHFRKNNESCPWRSRGDGGDCFPKKKALCLVFYLWKKIDNIAVRTSAILGKSYGRSHCNHKKLLSWICSLFCDLFVTYLWPLCSVKWDIGSACMEHINQSNRIIFNQHTKKLVISGKYRT